MLDNWFEDKKEHGLLFLRLGLGLVFLIHGLGKLFNAGPAALGMEAFTGFLTGLGIPLPSLAAWVVALVETLGGLGILLGVFTRYWAVLLGIDMLVALLTVHISKGFNILNGGYEYVLTLLLVLIAVLFHGAGDKWVLEKVWKE